MRTVVSFYFQPRTHGSNLESTHLQYMHCTDGTHVHVNMCTYAVHVLYSCFVLCIGACALAELIGDSDYAGRGRLENVDQG